MNNSLDDKAVFLARDYLRTEGLLLSVLIEMRRTRAFAPLNYSGIWDYCVHRLHLSSAQAYYFKSVAEKSDAVPELQAAVMNGKLSLSEARRIAPVITPENKTEWIAKAQTLPQKELERAVTAENPKARIREKIRPIAPTLSELRVAVDPTTEANIKMLADILSQKTGKPATLAEVIAWATSVTREKHDPARKAARSRSRKAVSLGQPKPGRQRIPAPIRHAVVQRDGNRCTHVAHGRRCDQRRWLDLHHVIEVAWGGANSVENLRTVCATHHRLRHDGRRPPEYSRAQEDDATKLQSSPRNLRFHTDFRGAASPR